MLIETDYCALASYVTEAVSHMYSKENGASFSNLTVTFFEDVVYFDKYVKNSVDLDFIRVKARKKHFSLTAFNVDNAVVYERRFFYKDYDRAFLKAVAFDIRDAVTESLSLKTAAGRKS